MIDSKKLAPILAGYKEHLPERWANERYKWEAVKHFQEHWNLEAPN